MPAATKLELEDLETKLLLEGIFCCCGADFRQYAPASLKRRIRNWMKQEGVATVSALQDKVLHDAAAMDRFLVNVTVNVTEMFRDPPFYRALRSTVVPLLRKAQYPTRIWDAGCSTGEEVYSLAILLREEGLSDSCRIYATDLNEHALSRAKEGIFSLSRMQDYSRNYLEAGGAGSLADYYIARYDNAIFDAQLRRNVVFGQHDLAIDSSFNEFDMILCRNVMIYFNQALKARVLKLLRDSLSPGGLLALGAKESLDEGSASTFKELDGAPKIYRLVY